MSLSFVGDPYQTLYNWRGAIPEFLMNYSDQFGYKKFHLSTNYRSDERLVNIINNFGIKEFGRDFTPAIPYQGKIAKRVISLKEFDNWDDERDEVASMIKKELLSLPPKEEQTETHRIMVLCRTNKIITDIEPMMIKHRIKYRIKLDSRSIIRQSSYRFINSVISLTISPRATIEFEDLALMVKGIGKAFIKAYLSLVETRPKFIPIYAVEDMVNQSEPWALKKKYASQIKKLSNFFSYTVEPIASAYKRGDAFNSIQSLRSLLTTLNRISIYEDSEVPPTVSWSLSITSEQMQSSVNLLSTMMTGMPLTDERLKWLELYDMMKSVSTSDDTKEDNHEPIVEISTIHGVKGLEADSVYLCAQKSLRYQTNRFEDACVLYVGLTRAKKRVVITSSDKHPHYTGKMIPTRMTDEFTNLYIALEEYIEESKKKNQE